MCFLIGILFYFGSLALRTAASAARPAIEGIAMEQTASWTVPLGVEETRVVLNVCLCRSCGYATSDTAAESQRFVRGDTSMHHVTGEQRIAWISVPVEMVASYRPAPHGGCTVELALKTVCRVPRGSEIAGQFESLICEELNEIGAALLFCTARDDEPAVASDSSILMEAYATLKLKPGAPWRDVQAAYRDFCLKFHPDTLSGKDVPQHLVELAVAQFRNATSAYQLLKEKLAK